MTAGRAMRMALYKYDYCYQDIFHCLTGGACALPVEKIAHQCSKLRY